MPWPHNRVLQAAFRGRQTAATLKLYTGLWCQADRDAFRGRQTAATLKHKISQQLPNGKMPLPRSADRGHIEASVFPRWGSRRLAFRGRQTAATLKLAHSLPGQRRMVAFRGRQTAATLKPISRPGFWGRNTNLPRSADRGHIEADLLCRCAGRYDPLPRSADRGHIEAVIPSERLLKR
jgi:hypothetical protein